jgi:hypothetical protein
VKKGLLILGTAAFVLGAGGYTAYQYGMNLAADKISEELESNPELMKQMDEEIKKNEKEIAKLGEAAATQEKTVTAQDKTAVEGATEEKAVHSSSRNEAAVNEKSSSVTKTEEKSPEPTSTGGTGKSPETSKPSGGTQFSSRNEAVRFAMSRFSASEMNMIRKMAADGLTSEEKAKLKSIAYSKFTGEEIAAVQRAVSN